METKNTVEKFWAHHVLTKQLSTCTPAARMVVIEAFCFSKDDYATEHILYPVVCLSSYVIFDYSKRVSSKEQKDREEKVFSYSTHKQLKAAHYELHDKDMRIDPCFVSEGGITNYSDYSRCLCCNSAVDLFVFSGDGDDTTKLSDVIEVTKEQAIKNTKFNNQCQAKLTKQTAV